MRGTPILALLLLVGLLAGCADEEPVQSEPAPDGDAGDDVAVPPSEAAPAPVTAETAFGWLAAGGVPGTGADAQVMSSNAAFFDVPEGVLWLRAEASWSCLLPTCPLVVQLGPRGSGGDLLTGPSGAQATGDGEAVLEVEAPEAGEWVVSAHSEGVTADLSGVFRISYMLGQAPATGMEHQH